jgi:excisionase family DNA binding protein
MHETQFLTTSQAAEACGVSVQAIRVAADLGRIKSIRVGRWQRLFRPEDVRAFADGRATRLGAVAARHTKDVPQVEVAK